MEVHLVITEQDKELIGCSTLLAVHYATPLQEVGSLGPSKKWKKGLLVTFLLDYVLLFFLPRSHLGSFSHTHWLLGRTLFILLEHWASLDGFLFWLFSLWNHFGVTAWHILDLFNGPGVHTFMFFRAGEPYICKLFPGSRDIRKESPGLSTLPASLQHSLKPNPLFCYAYETLT